MKANADVRCVSMLNIKLCRLITPQIPQYLDKKIVGKRAKEVSEMGYHLTQDGGCELSLTFCLSNIFMAKYCSVPLCFTNITLPNEPVPSVFNLSKSSRHVVLCRIKQPVSFERLLASISMLRFYSTDLWRAFPFP